MYQPSSQRLTRGKLSNRDHGMSRVSHCQIAEEPPRSCVKHHLAPFSDSESAMLTYHPPLPVVERIPECYQQPNVIHAYVAYYSSKQEGKNTMNAMPRDPSKRLVNKCIFFLARRSVENA
jgi:hypothetical protein